MINDGFKNIWFDLSHNNPGTLSVSPAALTEYPDKKEVCKDGMIHLIQLCQQTTAEQERKHFTLDLRHCTDTTATNI